MLLVAGCQANAPSATPEPVQAPCDDNFGVSWVRGPRGPGLAGARCEEPSVLTPVGRQPWREPKTDQEVIIEFDQPAPIPYRWGEWIGSMDAVPWLDPKWAPATDLWWLEDVEVTTLEEEQKDIVFPITSFACKQLPSFDEWGELQCDYAWSVRASRRQVTANAWAARVGASGEVLEVFQLGAELSGSIRRAVEEQRKSEQTGRRTLLPKEGELVVVWVGGTFRQDYRELRVTGRPCRMNLHGEKDCPPDFRVFSTGKVDEFTQLDMGPINWTPAETTMACILPWNWEPFWGSPSRDYSRYPGRTTTYEWTFGLTSTTEAIDAVQAYGGLLGVEEGLNIGAGFDGSLQDVTESGVEMAYELALRVKESHEQVPTFHVGTGYRFFVHPEVGTNGGTQDVHLTQVGGTVVPLLTMPEWRSETCMLVAGG